MNKIIEILNIKKLYNKDKKTLKKIFLILISLNILLSILGIATNIFSVKGIMKLIVFTLLAIIQIGPILMIYFLTKRDKEKSNPNFEKIYDPIITNFIINSELKYSESLIYEELEDLKNREFLEEVEQENEIVYLLKNKETFKRIGTLENINNINIEEYYSEQIPAYENLFVTKVLFAFEDKITASELKRKIRDNYYAERMQLCDILMEKLLVHHLEKRNMILAENSIDVFSIILLINIIVALFLFASMGTWNLLWILAIISNILVSGVILKQQKIFSYKFSEEIYKYIDDLMQND